MGFFIDTSCAALRMNVFAWSFQIAGTVITQFNSLMVKDSELHFFRLSNKCCTRYFIAYANTFTAGNSLPRMSDIVVSGVNVCKTKIT